MHGLSTIMEIASNTENLNLSNTEVRWGTQILLRKECGRPYGWRQTKENGFVGKGRVWVQSHLVHVGVPYNSR